MLRKDGCAALIDYQGVRWGLAGYDVASMVYDAYVPFSDDQREQLLDVYLRVRQDVDASFDRALFERLWPLLAAQRLMQALGAFGMLGHVKGKREFLEHIPAAWAKLRQVAGSSPELAPLLSLQVDVGE